MKMKLYLTGLGVVFASLLWIFVDFWEWSVPKVLEEKIVEWKKKWQDSQGVLRFVIEEPILDQEHFMYSLKGMLPRLERELEVPLHVEVEVNHQDIVLSDEEVRYINCLTRAFSEFTWNIKDRVKYEAD
jgi:hypothetical protein